MPNKVPYLCGGIFFGLLLQARKNRTKARDKQKGGSDGLSDADVMKALVHVVTGNETKVSGKTFAKATSQYKSCQISDNTYIPFKDVVTIAAFDNAVKNHSEDVEMRISDFVFTYINDKKREWLAKALFEVIKLDETIPDNELFEIFENHSLPKSELIKEGYIDLPHFLLSVLHFILTKRPDNEPGIDTFEAWFTRVNQYAEWKFNSDIGLNIVQRIECSISKFPMAIFGKPSDGKTKRIDSLPEYTHSGGFTSLVSTLVKNKENPYERYLEKTRKFYSSIKTLLYSEKPRNFYDFYVCNDLNVYRNTGTGLKAAIMDNEALSDMTIDQIALLSNFAIISGTGGIGKTMMMRHLLLDSIARFDFYGKLPVFIALKNYSSDCDLKTFIYQSFRAIDISITKEQIFDLMDEGNCIILLDGLDEIASSLRDKFEKELELLTISCPENVYVISSRPTTQFLSYKRFTIFRINEFTKKQALSLIDKLDFYDKEAKSKFRADLDVRLFQTHKQFASNPLLLTIMLMTYSAIGDIPRKMHIFYAKAFETMARLHDATKGAYVRPLYCGLEPEEFAKYFAEFCARTYRDEELEFTSISFCDYMDRVLKNKDENLTCTAWDFLLDLKDNLCIMYEEGDKYYFIHRSFQEYFAAVFFSSQMDDKLPIIAEQFKDMRQKSYHDKTFDMLYDMIPHRVDRYIFAPYLQKLWDECDEKDGYWTFLQYMYPTIYSHSGDVEEWYENTPTDYFYDFVVNENLIRHNGKLDDLDWPANAMYFKKDFARIQVKETTVHGERETSKVVDTNSYEFDFFLKSMEEDYEPDYCGEMWEIEIDSILADVPFYQQLIAYMENDEFPLKKEYNLMRQYSDRLFARLNKLEDPTDWFANFV